MLTTFFMQNINANENNSFIAFFIRWELIWPNLYYLDPTHFDFWLMSRNLINIITPVIMLWLCKKLLRLLQLDFEVSIWQKTGPAWARPKIKFIIFFLEIKKDHVPSTTFYFIKLSWLLFELWMIFYFGWCFLVKKGHSQLKHLWEGKLRFFNLKKGLLEIIPISNAVLVNGFCFILTFLVVNRISKRSCITDVLL